MAENDANLRLDSMMATPTMPIEDIIIGDRFRIVLGDIKELSKSIDSVGLLHPIVLSKNRELIAGRRRIEACKELGWKEIPVHIVTLEDLKRGEYDENAVRKDFVASEMIAIKRYYEPEIKDDAKKRQKATLPKKGEKGFQSGGKLPPHKGKTRDIVAKFVGVSGRTLEKAKYIVMAAEKEPKKWGELIESVDSGKTSIDGAHKQVKAQERAEAEAALARTGKTLAQIKKQDCIDFLKELDDKSVDLLITDPPFYTDVDDIETFVASWLNLALSKIKDTGQAYIFIGAYAKEQKTYLTLLENGGEKRFGDPQILVWTYKNTIGPKPSKQYKRNWHAILYLRGLNAPNLNCVTLNEQNSVQEFNAPDARYEKKYHKWQKPIELAKRLIIHGSDEGSFVIDPFAGSGTFLLAAASLGRKNIGVDIDDSVINNAVERGCILVE